MTPDDMTSKNPGPRMYTTTEMEGLWPSAAGELRGYSNALNRGNAGITAAQMRMAIQIADLYLLSLQRGVLVKPDTGEKTG